MQNDLFLAPASRSGSAFEHLRRSVIKGIPPSVFNQDIDGNKDRCVRVWGLTSGLRSAWESADSGDWLLFYTGKGKYQYAARISGKAHNPELGERIRSEFVHVKDNEKRRGKEWEFLLYLDPPVHIDLPGKTLSDWLGYERAYRSRFQRVPEERTVIIEDKFGSLDGLVEEFRE